MKNTLSFIYPFIIILSCCNSITHESNININQTNDNTDFIEIDIHESTHNVYTIDSNSQDQISDNNIEDINIHNDKNGIYLLNYKYDVNYDKLVRYLIYIKEMGKYWIDFEMLSGYNVYEFTGTFMNNPDFSSFKINYVNIVAGRVPDIFWLRKSDVPFYARAQLIYPITNQMVNSRSAEYNYVKHIWVDNDIYAAYIPLVPGYMMLYNKSIINDLGLYDPLDIWIEGNWTWDTWLDMLLTVRTEMDEDKFMLFGGDHTQSMFLSSNGVDYAIVNENGRYVFSLDKKYVNAIKFYQSLQTAHAITIYNNMYNYHGYVDMIMDGVFITSYNSNEFSIKMGKKIYEDNKLTDKVEIFAEASTRNTDKIGLICAPRGPDLENNISSRDLIDTYEMAKVVPISCRNPEAAAMYIDWIMADHDNYAKMVNFSIQHYYTDAEFVQYGSEWAANTAYVLPTCFGTNLLEFIEDCTLDELLLPNNVRTCQALIDQYVNVFL